MKKSNYLMLLASLLIIPITSCKDTSDNSNESTSQNVEENSYTKDLSYSLSTDGTSYILVGKGSAYDINIKIPSTYEGKPVTEIANYAFMNSNISTLEMPSSITKIGDLAFENCKYLYKITLSSQLESIGTYCFSKCSELSEIKIPNSVTFIGESAFEQCNKLSYVKLSSKITTIEPGTFIGCSSLETIVFPESLTRIGGDAFHGCESLKQVELKNISTIESYTFAYCSSLKEITIPESVELIDTGAFLECSSLETITITTGLKRIKESAFKNCTSLNTIYYSGTNDQWNKITIDKNNDSLLNARIYKEQ